MRITAIATGIRHADFATDAMRAEVNGAIRSIVYRRRAMGIDNDVSDMFVARNEIASKLGIDPDVMVAIWSIPSVHDALVLAGHTIPHDKDRDGDGDGDDDDDRNACVIQHLISVSEDVRSMRSDACIRSRKLFKVLSLLQFMIFVVTVVNVVVNWDVLCVVALLATDRTSVMLDEIRRNM